MTGTYPRVVVIGSGLGGLATATLLARGGATVTLLEKSTVAGGRARTQRRDGWAWNLGPHALYAGGAAARTLRALGIPIAGGKPKVGGYAIRGGVKHTLPGGPVSLLTTRLLGVGEKVVVGKLLAALPKVDPGPLARVTTEDWITAQTHHESVRDLLRGLFRLSTYAATPEQSAGAAITNLQHALRDGVYYLDGGWQSLIDALQQAAVAAGVTIAAGERASAIDHDGRVRGVRGVTREFACDAVVVAAGPRDLLAVCPAVGGAHARAAADARPVRAACLDVGMSALPVPVGTFALGLDVPVYLSVHSMAAQVAPPGSASVHVAKYLPADTETDPHTDERELEALLDLVQPGWRAVVVDRRFLPQLVVANAVPTAAGGGLPGRPDVAVSTIEGLYAVGDWVGAEGLLADSSLASATEAAASILARRAAAA
jgi:phytoene dehydrogenase-like protein